MMFDQRVSLWTGESLGPDNWMGVSDRKKRKQIQDRLAQRSRRRYFVELRLNATCTHS